MEQSKQEGFISSMLQVAVAEEVATDIKLAAAIQMKNMVKEHWKFDSVEDAQRFLDPREFEGRLTIILTQAEKGSFKQEVVQASARFASFEILS